MLKSMMGIVTCELKEATDFVVGMDFTRARDKCLRSSSLLDLIEKSVEIGKVTVAINSISKTIICIMEDISHLDQWKVVHSTIQTNVSVSDNDNNNNDNIPSVRTIKFKDIIGNEIAKQALYECIILRFKLEPNVRSHIFKGIRKLSGNVLLYGPPGCGKTALIEAVACEAQLDLISIRPSDILSKYQGESEKHIRDLCERATLNENAIIFFDEFDSFAMARGNSDDTLQSRRLLAEILLLMNRMKLAQIENASDIVVVAATNRLEDLDEAIIRRFDTKIYVGILDKNSRIQFIRKLVDDLHHDLTNDDFETIGDRTDGWSGSDIEMLCREAAMVPLRQNFHFTKEEIVQVSILRKVRLTDFESVTNHT